MGFRAGVFYVVVYGSLVWILSHMGLTMGFWGG